MTKRRRTSNARRMLGGGKDKSQSRSSSAYKSSSHGSKHDISRRFKSASLIPETDVERRLKGFKPLPGIAEDRPISKKQIMSFGMDLLPSPEFDLLSLAKDITELYISYEVDGTQYTENYWKSLSLKLEDLESFKRKCIVILHSISQKCDTRLKEIAKTIAGYYKDEYGKKRNPTATENAHIVRLKTETAKISTLYHATHQEQGVMQSALLTILYFVERQEK